MKKLLAIYNPADITNLSKDQAIKMLGYKIKEKFNCLDLDRKADLAIECSELAQWISILDKVEKASIEELLSHF